jgi:hypothetical protein
MEGIDSYDPMSSAKKTPFYFIDLTDNDQLLFADTLSVQGFLYCCFEFFLFVKPI